MEKREIKFRAWDEVNKQMTSSFSIKDFGASDIGELKGIEGFEDCQNFLQTAIILQFTGLLDRNRKEIYENDLSKNYYKGQWVVLQVVWNPLGMWSVKWKDGYINNYHINNKNMEIIGNIYENPELIK